MNKERVEILIVDDREENLLALEVILANDQYSFVRAASGKDALKKLLQDHDFAIILMDVQMPGMDGFETAELIRQSEKFNRVPIIFLTANTNNQEDVFKGYQTGAVDFMVKPLSGPILKAKVAVFVDLYLKNHELFVQGENMKILNAKLEQQTEYVRSLIEGTLDPLFTINSEGFITDMNEAFAKITDAPRSKITGEPFFHFFTRPSVAEEAVREVFDKDSVKDFQLTLKSESGKTTDVLINGSVYRDSRGKVMGAVVVAREKILSRYSRSLIEASLDPLITINSEGKITDMNQALSNITGITREKITGTDFFDYFTDREKAKEVYQQAFLKGIVIDSPLTIRHRDGKLTDVLFNGSVYKDDRGYVQGIVIVARDITARKKFENELIEARHRAEEAVKAKQQFLSNMSHEIRTPMNAIVGFTKVVLKTNLDEKQREYINAIKISGDALIVLINDILDLAKVDAGKMTFEQIPFKLSVSLHAMLHLFEAKATEKNLKLIREYDSEIPEVLVGDPVRLHQVILNLVSNALKFTSKGSITVAVNVVKQDRKKIILQFSVKDTGIGIPENKLDSIFDNFQQASSGTSRVYGGTGLGLAIVRQLVLAQGGTVTVESRQGKGSAFNVSLPFKKTNEQINQEPDNQRDLIDGRHYGKILVVEDVALNQLLMKTLLEEAGFDLVIADNGKKAVELMKDDVFDLVLMDLQMPEMNGFEATEVIRKELKQNVPIIALTADVTSVDLNKCRMVGMNDYLSKPIDDKLLFKKIANYLIMDDKEINTQQTDYLNIEKTDKNGRLTNLDFLRQLTKNNREMINEMITVYLEETPELLAKMRTALYQKDWKSLREAAHSIYPSFATVGMDTAIGQKAKDIQILAEKRENLEEVKDLLTSLESICAKASEELRSDISSNSEKYSAGNKGI